MLREAAQQGKLEDFRRGARLEDFSGTDEDPVDLDQLDDE